MILILNTCFFPVQVIAQALHCPAIPLDHLHQLFVPYLVQLNCIFIALQYPIIQKAVLRMKIQHDAS